jgi:hypothetical protein
MSTVGSRLGSYALVLVGLFGFAYALGERLPGHEHSAAGSSDGHAHGSSSSDTSSITTDLLGLSSVAPDGHRLVVDDSSSTTLTFHVERAATIVTQFDEQHGAQLHLLLVRRDLSGFQHLHPTMSADGTWTAADVDLSTPGAWRVVIDALPTGADPLVVGTDVLVPGTAEVTPLPAADDMTEVDGLMLHRDGLAFTATPTDGLAPYLGQSAHLVAFRQGDLAYVHLHPANDVLGDYQFAGELPGPGTYRMFLQFIHDGAVVTVPFTVVQS